MADEIPDSQSEGEEDDLSFVEESDLDGNGDKNERSSQAVPVTPPLGRQPSLEEIYKRVTAVSRKKRRREVDEEPSSASVRSSVPMPSTLSVEQPWDDPPPGQLPPTYSTEHSPAAVDDCGHQALASSLPLIRKALEALKDHVYRAELALDGLQMEMEAKGGGASAHAPLLPPALMTPAVPCPVSLQPFAMMSDPDSLGREEVTNEKDGSSDDESDDEPLARKYRRCRVDC